MLLASPSTLIGLLRAVHVGFQEQMLAEEAITLRRLGADYNKFVASYEQRLGPTVRRFGESGAKSAKELPRVQVVSTQLRLMSE